MSWSGPMPHGYRASSTYHRPENSGRLACAQRGGFDLAFDRPIDEMETAAAPAPVGVRSAPLFALHDGPEHTRPGCVRPGTRTEEIAAPGTHTHGGCKRTLQGLVAVRLGVRAINERGRTRQEQGVA